MADEKDGKKYWKEVRLVILGAVLASIPTLISTYMHGKTEIQRFIIDRQLSALKEYSICHNKIITDILPVIEKYDEEISSLYDEYLRNPTRGKVFISELKQSVESVMATHQKWSADFNSQRIMVNALFHVNIRPILLSSPPYKDESGGKGGSIEDRFKALKGSVAGLKQQLIKQIDEGQIAITELSSMIGRN